jgi:hypothetical protein
MSNTPLLMWIVRVCQIGFGLCDTFVMPARRTADDLPAFAIAILHDATPRRYAKSSMQKDTRVHLAAVK